MREPMPATRRLGVFETIREAWELTKGSKWAIWAPVLVIFGVCVGFALIFGLGLGFIHKMTQNAGSLEALAKLATVIISLTLIAGILLLLFFMFGLFAGVIKVTLERARGNLVSGSTGFHSFSRAMALFFTNLLLIIIVEVPLIIALVFVLRHAQVKTLNELSPPAFIATHAIMYSYGLIVGSLFYLASFFAVDQTKNPFLALGRSVKTSIPHWLRIMGIVLMVYVISFVLYIPTLLGAYLHNTPLLLIGSILFFVAIIWLIPFLMLIPAVIYHKLVD